MMANDIRWWMGPKFSDIRLTFEEKPRKKPLPGKLTRPGIEPASARWEATMLPKITVIYIYICIYRVIHEECHSFGELICHVMLMKKVHMNMGPIFNSFGENVYLQKWHETLWTALSWPTFLLATDFDSCGFAKFWATTWNFENMMKEDWACLKEESSEE